MSDETSLDRRCLVTRETAPRQTMVRFVVDPDDIVRPDIDERLPGRGMWLSADRDVVNKAVRKRVFGQVARRHLVISEDLADRIERLLTRRMFDALGLARRAGLLAMGFDQVQASIRSLKAALLIAASDGAEDGRRKLRQLAPDLPLIRMGSRSEMGAALGREELVHATVGPGKLALRLQRDALRLAGFRPDVVVEPATGLPSGRTLSKGISGTP